MSVAFVFPGQGSQVVGMGRAMAEAFATARATFAEADRALADEGLRLSELCFDGPLEDLTLTANTQPALVATSVACVRALRERVPGLEPALVAGHSLGEYSALVAAGALDFADTLRLVRLRGQAMQDAVPTGTGSMAAVMALEAADVESLCREASMATPGRMVSAANYNAPGQTVVAGHADAVAKLIELASSRRAKAVLLKVSAPFHCALMQPAAERLASALEQISVRAPVCPVMANVDAQANADAARVAELLVRQVAGAVRWEQSVRAMVDAGVDTFVEIGPGKVLSGLIKRIHKDARLLNVADPASLEATAAALG